MSLLNQPLSAMASSVLWNSQDFLEYFLKHLRTHPTCQVHIITYLLTKHDSGVVHDICLELNKRPSCIYVGTTRFVSQRALDREIKAYKKAYPRVKVLTAYNDHRKVFLCTYHNYLGAVRLPNTYRCWMGSANFYDSRTKNLVIEVPPSEIDNIRQEISNLIPL